MTDSQFFNLMGVGYLACLFAAQAAQSSLAPVVGLVAIGCFIAAILAARKP